LDHLIDQMKNLIALLGGGPGLLLLTIAPALRLALAGLDAHMNVSVEGFSADSHGVFRGRREGFQEIVGNVNQFAKAGILQGLRCCARRTTSPRTRSTGSYRTRVGRAARPLW